MAKATKTLFGDAIASAVGALSGIPASIGIAVSAGLGPNIGLLSNIVGTGFVGMLSRSRFQVNGPTTSLAVGSAIIYQSYGAFGLAFTVFVCGIIQVSMGALGVGWWFKVLPRSVVEGTTIGIGLLTILSQVKILLGANLLIGLSTFALIFLLQQAKWRVVKYLSPALIALLFVSGAAHYLGAEFKNVALDGNLFTSLGTAWHLSGAAVLTDWHIWVAAASMSFIASSKSMIVSSMLANQDHRFRFDNNHELKVQGYGNVICGLLGVLPISAVTERSALTQSVGGKTRAAVGLQAVWIILLAASFPHIVTWVPQEAFAGILMYGGYKIINQKVLRESVSKMYADRLTLYGSITAVAACGLAFGVMMGLMLAILKLALTFASDCKVSIAAGESNLLLMRLEGAFTFANIPKLDTALSSIKPSSVVSVDSSSVYYIDSGCIAYFEDLAAQLRANGGELLFSLDSFKLNGYMPKNIRADVISDLKKLDRRSGPREEPRGRRAMDRYLAGIDEKSAARENDALRKGS